MKVIQVTPGILPIPPKGWGALEIVIWNYKLSFEKLGHECSIKYLNEINDEEIKNSIIHIHVADLALEAKKRGMKYIYTLHDHHVEIFDGTKLINQQAIEGAEIAFVPSEHLLDFFGNPPNLFYVPHGVDTNLYIPDYDSTLEPKLLCVGNNGLHGNFTIDRKGFLLAIEVANKLNIPLTIAGPTNCNKDFFEHHKDLLNDNIKLVFDATEKELIKLYQSHTIFLHPSSLEAGHPNLTLLEATACGLPIVGTFKGTNKIESMYVCERNVDELYKATLAVLVQYPTYKKQALLNRNKYSWDEVCKKLEVFYNKASGQNNIHTHKEMKDTLVNMYNNLHKKNHIYKNRFVLSYYDGVHLSIKGFEEKEYNVKFIDSDIDKIIYETTIKNGHWSQPNQKFYTNWKVLINDEEFNLNLENKKVLITLESSALGDTIAWIPYAEEFRKKHNCLVTITTFHNHLFEKSYPNVEFIEPGVNMYDYYAWYRIGVFDKEGKDDFDKNKNAWRDIPLQQTITDILGLEYKEIKPNIYSSNDERIIKEKYVVIAPHSTLKAKLWNYANGWKNVVTQLKRLGYKVICLTKDPEDIKGSINYNNKSLEEVVNIIKHSDFLIGLGSGLSWLAWGLNKPVIMISGFSRPYSEFSCYRITTPAKFCTGCYNDKLCAFDRGDWNWCPRKKDFECTTTITPKMVLKVIDELIEKENLK